MKLATTTGDFLSYCNSPAEAVRAFVGTGFTHLDYNFFREAYPGSDFLSENWMEKIKAASKEAEKAGFDFVQAHSPANNFLDKNQDYETVVKANLRSIEACGYLGIPNLVVHSGGSADFCYPSDREKYFEANRKFYERLYPAMEKYNVNVLVENSATQNRGSMYCFMNGEEARDFVEFCGHPKMGVCWDVGHANMQNPNQYDDIIALGQSLKAVHIQDNFGNCDEHIAPMMGTLDIDAVMHGLIDGGFVDNGGVFTFECDNILMLPPYFWPHCRNMKFKQVTAKPTLELKRAAITFLYQIGKTILTEYNLFEE